jgi:hypothetical protein
LQNFIILKKLIFGDKIVSGHFVIEIAGLLMLPTCVHDIFLPISAVRTVLASVQLKGIASIRGLLQNFIILKKLVFSAKIVSGHFIIEIAGLLMLPTCVHDTSLPISAVRTVLASAQLK